MAFLNQTLILLFFGLLPSAIWLLFFLRKDVHPEPKLMVLKIFFWGVFITLPAALLEKGILEGLTTLIFLIPPILIEILYLFVGIALVEETFKYLVVKWKVLSNPEFDEPLDIMLYMIIAGLGFAGLENILLENILYLFDPSLRLLEISLLGGLWEISKFSGLRFIGATFLHALCSGLVGYFLALSFFGIKNRIKLTAIGLGLAIILHGLFNFFIINIGGSTAVENNELFIINLPLFIFSLFSVIIILVGLAIFVSLGFQKLKKMKSICLFSKN